MPRKLTATTGVLLALVFAGCGKDDSSSSAQSAATTTTPAATTPAKSSGTKTKTKKTTGSKANGSKNSPSTKTDAQTTGSKSPKTAGSKATGTSGAAKKKKVTTTTTPLPAIKPKPSTSDLTSGTGAGPAADRADVVAVLRRYYKGFTDEDGAAVCALLTSSGKQIMIRDGNGKTCPTSVKRLIASTSAANIALLQRTRDGLHIDDIKVSGDNATAQIGKTSQLKLVQQDGKWLVRSPNVEVSSS